MRRIIIAIGTTLTGLALLFSWPTSWNRTATATTGLTDGTTTDASASGTSDSTDGTAGTTPDATSGTTDGSTGAAAGDGTTSDGSTGSADTGSSTTTSTTGTYTGAAAATRYGDVQVEITVTDGVITAARALEYPGGDRKNVQINAYAIPILEEQTVTNQGAVDMISGATVTSRGYAQSLQDALDQAAL
jgi:uncharacterized protein with FMN-binding domain